MKKIFVFTLVACCCAACELTKDIDYPTLFDSRRLVVHGRMVSGGGVEVVVRKTLPPNQVAANDVPRNARVALFENEVKLFDLTAADDDSTLFATPAGFTVTSGARYRVEATADDMEPAVSAVQTPVVTVPIDSMRLFPYDDEYATNYANLVVYFTHDASTGYGYTVSTCCWRNGKIDEWRSDSLSFANDIFLYVEDDYFPAGRNGIEVRVDGAADSIQVKLYTLSPDLLHFLKSQSDYSYSIDNPFFEQPFTVFSNIEGGYGLFGGYGVAQGLVRN